MNLLERRKRAEDETAKTSSSSAQNTCISVVTAELPVQESTGRDDESSLISANDNVSGRKAYVASTKETITATVPNLHVATPRIIYVPLKPL
jgi:hypothetical protein